MVRVAEGGRIDEMLAQSARRYGRRVALKQGRFSLTYERLDGLAMRLAEKLNHAYKLVRDPRFTACGEILLASEQDPVEA